MLKDLSREQQLMVLGLVFLIVVGSSVMVFRRFFDNSDTSIKIETPPAASFGQTASNMIFVHVSGAVNSPGVYKLEYGKRTMDVIELAGGAQSNADLDSLNLAQVLKDEQKAIIPQKISSRPAQTAVAPGREALININTADTKTLQKIKGVGKATAERIVEYRSKNGCFSSIEDLAKVPKFKKSLLKNLKDKVCL